MSIDVKAAVQEPYGRAEQQAAQSESRLASLGCGNPAGVAGLREGEIVLDLGSGGGVDVLLAAKKVGPTGKAYGLDLTDEMLALAQENQRRAGVDNAEFLKAEIEEIPLPDNSVDVIISNCVVNLSGDKRQVLAEAFRVLRPGGRLVVSDLVVRDAVPASVRGSLEECDGCAAAALTKQEFQSLLRETGFEHIGIEPTRIYRFEDGRVFLGMAGLDTEVLAHEVGGSVMGALVRARKPHAGVSPG